MEEMRARIRSVRYKDGRAPLTLLPTPMPDNYGTENFRGKLISAAKTVASDDRDLDGYVVIGLFADGGTNIGFRISNRIPSTLAPAYIAELMRRDAVTNTEARHVFDEKFEWIGG